jgi:outer membrane lipoprotein carrier protein
MAAVPAVAANALDRWLDGFSSVQASFTQEIRDARGQLVENGRGELYLARPGRLRWDYRPAGAAADAGQLLVCDGVKLWFFDRDLAQVTVRDAADALATSPLMLLAGAAADVDRVFAVAPLSGGAEGVSVTPRTGSSDFERAELRFRRGALAGLQIHDRLGQVISLQFTRVVRNARIDPALLQFTPPAGADVIGATP